MDWPEILRTREAILEFEQQPGLLIVRATSQNGRRDALMTVVILALASPMFLTAQGWVWFTLLALGAIVLNVYRMYRPLTNELRVTDTTLTAVAKGTKFFPDTVARYTLRELTYDSGGENDAAGLYALTGWTRTLMLPSVNERQCWQIADRIYAAFPDTPTSPAQPSDLITLGLNDDRRG